MPLAVWQPTVRARPRRTHGAEPSRQGMLNIYCIHGDPAVPATRAARSRANMGTRWERNLFTTNESTDRRWPSWSAIEHEPDRFSANRTPPASVNGRSRNRAKRLAHAARSLTRAAPGGRLSRAATFDHGAGFSSNGGRNISRGRAPAICVSRSSRNDRPNIAANSPVTSQPRAMLASFSRQRARGLKPCDRPFGGIGA